MRLPWLLDNQYVFHVATMIAIMIPLALGMNLMLRIGQLSLAQPAFMAIGAYGSALLAMRLHVSPVLAIALSGAIAACVGSITGAVFLRIKGVYFALLTYAFGQIVNLVVQEWTSLFGGNNGLYGIPKFSLLGLRLTDVSHYYMLGLLFAIVCYLAVRAIDRSDIGAVLQSVSSNEMLSLCWKNSGLVPTRNKRSVTRLSRTSTRADVDRLNCRHHQNLPEKVARRLFQHNRPRADIVKFKFSSP